MATYGTQNASIAWAQGYMAPKSKPCVGSKSGTRRGRISDQTVREIRALRQYKGFSYENLASRYALSLGQITNIIAGQTAAFVFHSEEDLPDGDRPDQRDD